MDSFVPGTFSGLDTENAKDWLRNFDLYCTLKGLKAQAELAAFALSMRENASRWLLIVPDDIRSNKKDLYDAFLTRFTSSPQTHSEKMRQFWTARQEEKESVRNFIDRMQSIASDLSIKDPILTTAIQSGLKPSIKQHVARQNPQTVSALLDHALLAESTDFGTESSMTDVTAAIRRLEEKFDKVQIAAMSTDATRDDQYRRSSSPGHHPYDRRYPSEQERYAFPQNTLSSPKDNQYTSRGRSPSPFRSSRHSSSPGNSNWQGQNSQQQNFVSNYNGSKCYRCLGDHEAQYCSFRTLVCRFCSVRGHIMRACRKRSSQGAWGNANNY